jgi:DNA-binding transcriptional LysR family regulator
MEPTLTALRVLRAVAEVGSFTAAATSLGYSQSAISRQIASLERTAGAPMFDRRPDGVTLTAAGLVMLRHTAVALDEIDAAARELSGLTSQTALVRLGAYISAGAALVPDALVSLRRSHPDIEVTTREGTTPSLIRAVRAGTLDLAIVSSRPPHRPPDEQAPPLDVVTLREDELLLAVPAAGRLGGRTTAHIDELTGLQWIATPSTPAEPLLGVWPGLPGRPRVLHSARDWTTKLRLVAAGLGATTVPAMLAATVPPGVHVLRVTGGIAEVRRVLIVRLPKPSTGAAHTVIEALRTTTAQTTH